MNNTGRTEVRTSATRTIPPSIILGDCVINAARRERERERDDVCMYIQRMFFREKKKSEIQLHTATPDYYLPTDANELRAKCTFGKWRRHE